MSVIDQLNDTKTRAFARHCYEKGSEEQLRKAAEGPADQKEMKQWDITEGEWEEAVAAALADKEVKDHPPGD
ncbi:hypothetical protein [uncultured Halomonas sp.]|uniref:hypothetical protein n=1 Tax=uncultured Halomonas sp. TaxID=173971 RepID=UPI002634B3C2|nr:hypothetical protein [uncultured Halomonas sp.]